MSPTATVVTFGKDARQAPKGVRSSMETLLLDKEQINQWRIPAFQRPVRVNAKVTAMAEELATAEGGVIKGVITLGRVGERGTLYIVDGQHRIEAFKISSLKECIADVRIMTFDHMADMAEEFVNLNTQLVRMRPDDILRGLEGSVKALQEIRERAPYVGYDQVRRGSGNGPVVSMSAVLRCWGGSRGDTPNAAPSGRSAAQLAREIDDDETNTLLRCLTCMRSAWGNEPANYRLWSNLNITVCMWLFRKLVIEAPTGKTRYVHLTQDQFKKCLMSAAADSSYVDWLVGRQMSDRDRTPCYARLKTIFANRVRDETGEKKVQMPQPAWAS